MASGATARSSTAPGVPPGQHVVNEFPVSSVGTTPRTPLDARTFGITGAIDEPVSWTWAELRVHPVETPTVEIHPLTDWSKLDTVVVSGLGVLLRDLLIARLGALLGAIGVTTIVAIGNLAVGTAKHVL